MKRLLDTTALIIVDVQQGLDNPVLGRRNNPQAETNMARLLQAWRDTERPIFHIRHDSVRPESPLHPSSPGNATKEIVQPREGEPVLAKSVNSAFIGTDLEQRLRREHMDSVVLVGLTSNQCVETTARMASNLGFDTYFVSDATAAFDRLGPDGIQHSAEEIHSVTLANLHDEFATIVSTNEVLERLHVAV